MYFAIIKTIKSKLENVLYSYRFLSIHGFKPEFSISFWKGLQCDDPMPIKNKYYIYSIHLFMPLNICCLFKFLVNNKLKFEEKAGKIKQWKESKQYR